MSSPPRSNILLKELHEKLDALKKKKDTMLEYYGDTKGHSYRRGPQLDKIERLIVAAEQEIALMDPNPRRNKRGSAKHINGGVDDHAKSALLTDPGKEHPDTEAVEGAASLLLSWALESMTSGRFGAAQRRNPLSNVSSTLSSSDTAQAQGGYRSTNALLTPEADDSNFFSWLVGSFCDPYITVSAMQLERLPPRWISNVIRLAPQDTPEILSACDRRDLVHKAVQLGDQTLLENLLCKLSPLHAQIVAAVGLTFDTQLRMLSVEEKQMNSRLSSSIGLMITNGWADAFRAIYFSDDFKEIEKCSTLLPHASMTENRQTAVEIRSATTSSSTVPYRQQTASVLAPTQPHFSRSEHTSSATVARRRPATAAERWGTTAGSLSHPNSPPSPNLPSLQEPDAQLPMPPMDLEDIRTDERRRFALSNTAARIAHGQQRFQTFLRLPAKIVHGLLASLHFSQPHASSTLSIDPHATLDDANAIFDLSMAILSATGTSTSDFAALAQDQHSCDLLRDPLWVRHHLRRAAMERRRQCSFDLDRNNEERFWAYFLEELERAWTEGFDEHVLSAFVLGSTQRDAEASSSSQPASSKAGTVSAPTAAASRTSSAKSSMSVNSSAATKPLAKASSKSASIEPTTGVSGVYRALIDSEPTSQPTAANSNVSATPQVSGILPLSGSAAMCMNPQICCEAFHVLDNVVHQLHPKETLVYANDDANGTRLFTKDKLNLRADAPVSFEGAYCYHVDIPLAAGVAGTYRLGWATRDALTIGLVDQATKVQNLGEAPHSVGASFVFEPVKSESTLASSTTAGASSSFQPLSSSGASTVSMTPALSSVSQQFRVVMSVWCNGVASERVASVVVDLAQKKDDEVEEGGRGVSSALSVSRDANGIATCATVVVMMDATTGTASFAVEDEQFDYSIHLPTVGTNSNPSFSMSSAGGDVRSDKTFWFPAATLGIRPPPSKLPVVEQGSPRRRRSSYGGAPTGANQQKGDAVNRSSPQKSKPRNRSNSPSFSSGQLPGTESTAPHPPQAQQAPKKIPPPVVWKFDFERPHYEYLPIPSSNRILDTLQTLLHYGDVIETFRLAVDHLADDLSISAPCPPRPTSSGRGKHHQSGATANHQRMRRRSLSPPLSEDGTTSPWDTQISTTQMMNEAAAAENALRGREDHQYNAHVESTRLRSFLSEFVHSELRVQLNTLEELPGILMPKVLDVDDVLELVVGGDQYGRALQHLRISDRTLMRPPQRPDRDRDDRWFPHLARPVVKTKSRFGSMAAMRRSANIEHWNLLVDAVEGLCCPPLHAALMLGQREAVSLLIRSPLVDVNACDSVGNTPLILAVQFGLPSIVEYLVVVRNADVSLQNFAGLNALHVAIVNSQQQCLDILLAHPTAVNDSVLNVLTRGKSNAVGIATKLQKTELVVTFINRGAHPCIPDHFNVTPLCFALRHRDLATASRILEVARRELTRIPVGGGSLSAVITKEQINARERRNPRGTALLYAANIGAAGIVQQLLDLGADPTIYFSEPNCNVLHLAVASGSTECLEALLRVSTVAESTALLNGNSFGRGATPLHVAAEMGSVAMLAALCRCTAVDVNAPDIDGRTPLMVLMSSNFYDDDDESTAVTITHLVKRRLRVDQADKAGRTTLFYAAARGAIGVIRILIEACKASVNEVDIHGFSPLTFALARNQDAAAECILHIAGPKLNFMVARPNVPQAIEYAYSRGSIVVCRLILELGERCASDLRTKIFAEDEVVAAGTIAAWGDRRIPAHAAVGYRPYITVYGEGMFPNAPTPLGSHGTCASALLSWHSSHSGDPQHRRVSASCFGVAATVRPTAAERVAHRVLDLTACGDDAIAVLQRLEQGEIAVYRRGEHHFSTANGTGSQTGPGEVAYVDNGPMFTAATILEATSSSPDRHNHHTASYATTTNNMNYSEAGSEAQTDSDAHDVIGDLHRVFSTEKIHIANVPMMTSSTTTPQSRSPAATFLIPVGGDVVIPVVEETTTTKKSFGSGKRLLHPNMPLDQLIAQLLNAFGEFMPEVKSERALRLASTQVLLLLIEARTNCVRHAYLPICHGGYEMSVTRLEALAFQALQLNRESSVVAELQALVRISEQSNSLSLNVNASTQSKWGGRNVTMLHLAVLGRNASATRFLLGVGADPLLEISAHERPNAVADFEALSADSVSSRDFSSSINVSSDRRPIYVRIPCPMLCALRLGDEQIMLAMMRHLVENIAPSDHERSGGPMFQLFVPRRNPYGGQSGAIVFDSEHVPFLHCVAALCPQHSWQSPKALASFWTMLDSFSGQLNMRDSVSGLTAFQLAIACGRSDFVEWALRGKRRETISVEVNATCSVNVEHITQLFDALGIRCVAFSALEWLRQRHHNNHVTPTTSFASSPSESATNPLSSEMSTQLSVIELAFVCCPSIVRALHEFGFHPAAPTRAPESSLPPTASIDRPTPPSSAGMLPRLQSKRAPSMSSLPRSPSASPKHSPSRRASPQSARKRAAQSVVEDTVVQHSVVSAVQWKGTSALHLALRALLRVPPDGQSVRHEGGRPLLSAPTSPQLIGSPTRSFHGSALHFVPGAMVTRQDYGRYISHGLFSLVRTFNNQLRDTSAALAAAAAAALEQETTFGDVPLFPSGTVANTSFSSASAAAIPPGLTQLLDCDFGLFAIDPFDGSSPLHTAAASGYHDVVAELLSAGETWIIALSKQAVRISSRAPNASIQAQNAKVLEMKASVVTHRNKSNQSVLDVMLSKEMSGPWFHCLCSVLEWLPQGSAARIGYAEKLASRVHPLEYPSVALSSGLLQTLATQQQQQQQQQTLSSTPPPPENAIVKKTHSAFERATEVSENASRIVTLVFVGMLFSSLSGKQRVTWDALRKVGSIPAMTRTLMEFINPCLATIILSASSMSTSVYKAVLYAKQNAFSIREASVERTLAASSPAKPTLPNSRASLHSASPRPSIVQAASSGPPSIPWGTLDKITALSATRPGCAISDIAPNTILISMTAAERTALSNFIPPCQFDPMFDILFSVDGKQPAVPAKPTAPQSHCSEAGSWRGPPMLTSLADCVDDVASMLWSFAASCGCEKRTAASSAGSKKPQQLEALSASTMTSLQDQDRFRERLNCWFTAAAHFGMQSVFCAAWYRAHVANFLATEPERNSMIEAMLLDKRIVGAACRGKRPRVIFHLINCGAVAGNRSAEQQVAASNPSSLSGMILANEVFRRLRFQDDVEPTSQSDNPQNSLQPQFPSNTPTTEWARKAARLCLKVLFHGRTTISELTIQHIVSHSDLYHINEVSGVHRDSLLHIAVMNRALEAIVALAHTKKFTIGGWRNAFGLQAWEYASDTATLGHSLNKRNHSMNVANLGVSYFAAIAIVPDTTSIQLNSPTPRLDLSITSTSDAPGKRVTKFLSSQQPASSLTATSIPTSMIQALQDLMFVVEEDEAVEMASKSTPVLKVTLPAAVIASKLHAASSSSAPSAAIASSGKTRLPGFQGNSEASETATPPQRAAAFQLRECDRGDIHDTVMREKIVLQALTEAVGSQAQRSVSEIVLTDVSTRLAPVDDRKRSFGRGGDSDRLNQSRRHGTATVAKVPLWMGEDENLQVCILPMYW